MRSLFVILVQGHRAPMLLGPMSPEMRTQHLAELRNRYPGTGLHTLDVESDDQAGIRVRVERYEPQGGEA
jgi:hypothetical protein